MTVSSAKRRTIVLTWHGRSLIKIRNINSPSTGPWGTPEVTGTECECSPSGTTLCILFSRKLLNHCNVMSLMPHLNNLYSKPLCVKFLAKVYNNDIRLASSLHFLVIYKACLKPCWESFTILWRSKCLEICETRMCFINLQHIQVRETGR